MADKVTMSICILWEHELRVAARLLQKLETIPDDEGHSDQRSQCIVDGYRACQAALYGLRDEIPIAMLSSAPIENTAGRVRKAKGKR